MAGFEFVRSISGENDIPVELQIKASATVAVGDALEFTSGKLGRVDAQDDVVKFVCLQAAVATATSQTKVRVLPTVGKIFKVTHTPLVNDVAGVTNSTATTVKCALADGSSSDLVGGLVYCKELDQYRIITANTYSSDVVTITVAEGFTRAVTTTDTVRITAFGPGDAAVKLHGTNYHNSVSSVRGDEAGGKLVIRDITTSGARALKELFVEFLQA